jgi:hypothetical protein
MIREILDPNFIKKRMVELAVQLKKRSAQFHTAAPEVKKAAESSQVTAEDLDQASEVVAELARTGDYTRSTRRDRQGSLRSYLRLDHCSHGSTFAVLFRLGSKLCKPHRHHGTGLTRCQFGSSWLCRHIA